MKNMIYVHEITLPETDEFSKKFNYISWLWKMSCDETLSKEKQDFYANEHFDSKLALEMGYPISYLNEYSSTTRQD